MGPLLTDGPRVGSGGQDPMGPLLMGGPRVGSGGQDPMGPLLTGGPKVRRRRGPTSHARKWQGGFNPDKPQLEQCNLILRNILTGNLFLFV